ncbi:hypothetical protein M413DRAFT_449560 [Hebeloma cylindrosporum]|uniref:Uncharacterized protein n=1 Tax=Hebeloma cylindrosporum TaxID=76867 RepID=A0A0C3BUR0_HEBCY|nr:hypothetical protein M413DRAFT_449560 [Hebeloma cylindrosporum h7]
MLQPSLRYQGFILKVGVLRNIVNIGLGVNAYPPSPKCLRPIYLHLEGWACLPKERHMVGMGPKNASHRWAIAGVIPRQYSK